MWVVYSLRAAQLLSCSTSVSRQPPSPLTMSTAMFTGLRTGMRRDSAPDLHADPHSLARLVVGSQASCPYVSASFPTIPPLPQVLTTQSAH